jgi:hypothetical protein
MTTIQELVRLHLSVVRQNYHNRTLPAPELVMPRSLACREPFRFVADQSPFYVDSSLVCCTATNFTCEDDEGLLQTFYCQNVENGCTNGRFYQHQEKYPFVKIGYFQGDFERLISDARAMCPGSISKIKCCVLNPTSPIQPKQQDDPPEPVLSLSGSSDIAMLQDSWPVSQEDSIFISEPWSNEVNFSPSDNLQGGILPEGRQDFSFISNPSIGPLAETLPNPDESPDLQAFDPGLSSVASLSAAPGNGFTASLDESQLLPDEFSSNGPLLALAPDQGESSLNFFYTPIS